MRKLTTASNTHRGLLDESPAGQLDDVTTITRRNGRVYEVATNEYFGSIGICEKVIDLDGTIKWLNLCFWQSYEQAEYDNLIVRRNECPYFKSARWIVSLTADSFEE